MKILITNDDGIYADGIAVLTKWAMKIGEVTVVAPKTEQSGKSHGIELKFPFEVRDISTLYGARAFTVDSTPADCIRYALLGMKLECDLVLSGINAGYNIGTDMVYSGTVGAIFEAVALGVPGVAVSTCPGGLDGMDLQLDRVYGFFKDNSLLSVSPSYNVNIPPQGKDIRITRQGGPYYSDDFDPRGDFMYMPVGKCVYEKRDMSEFDTDAVMSGDISILPVTLDRTDLCVYESLKKRFQ